MCIKDVILSPHSDSQNNFANTTGVCFCLLGHSGCSRCSQSGSWVLYSRNLKLPSDLGRLSRCWSQQNSPFVCVDRRGNDRGPRLNRLMSHCSWEALMLDVDLMRRTEPNNNPSLSSASRPLFLLLLLLFAWLYPFIRPISNHFSLRSSPPSLPSAVALVTSSSIIPFSHLWATSSSLSLILFVLPFFSLCFHLAFTSVPSVFPLFPPLSCQLIISKFSARSAKDVCGCHQGTGFQICIPLGSYAHWFDFIVSPRPHFLQRGKMNAKNI